MEEKLSTNLDKVLKSRTITLPTKVHLVKASFSSSYVWIYGRKWQSTPVLLPGKSHGQRSLVGYSLWGHKESDTTEWLHSLSLMYGCEIWTIKKAEHQRIDAFQLWCWRRLLRVSLISRSNQLILKGINPEYSLARLLKLKLQYFGCLMQRANSLEKTLVLGKTEGRRRREWQRMRCWIRVLNVKRMGGRSMCFCIDRMKSNGGKAKAIGRRGWKTEN